MKHLKIVSVLLSAAITASMIVAPVCAIADEVPETSETEIVETEKETDPKGSEKKKPAETKAPEESSETGAETTKEEEKTEPSEETKLLSQFLPKLRRRFLKKLSLLSRNRFHLNLFRNLKTRNLHVMKKCLFLASAARV